MAGIEAGSRREGEELEDLECTFGEDHDSGIGKAGKGLGREYPLGGNEGDGCCHFRDPGFVRDWRFFLQECFPGITGWGP